MLIATWNVNSIRAREPRLLAWLEQHRPDVVCLQELKVADAGFPKDAVHAAGYHAEVLGQKTYNGVAILSRTKPRDVRRGLGDERLDVEARLIAATIQSMRVVCAYVPNGDVVGSAKYEFKLDWLAAFRGYLHEDGLDARQLVVCGDLNIAPTEADVAQPELWGGSVLFHPEMREQFRALLDVGLVDLFRLHHAEGGAYSWWDYRNLAFPRNNGLRIDHILASPPAAKRCEDAWIDREARKGTKPSDHAPVVARFARVHRT
jgi:exodeoxyribonuclease-3